MTDLVVDRPHQLRVWRVGYKPDPWAWAGWEWASDGRFHGRWDDRDGNFRTLYVGSSLLACLVEMLADFRPDSHLSSAMDEIDEDPVDAELFPTTSPGVVDPSWLTPRCVGTGALSGEYCSIAASGTLAALHPDFVGLALRLGLKDFDAAAVKDGRARQLTQTIATHLHRHTGIDGVHFASRHGDDLDLWAIFERTGDNHTSCCVTTRAHHELSGDDPALAQAFAMLDLRWREPPDSSRRTMTD